MYSHHHQTNIQFGEMKKDKALQTIISDLTMFRWNDQNNQTRLSKLETFTHLKWNINQ